MRVHIPLILAMLPASLAAQMPQDTVRPVEILRLGSVDGPDAFTRPGGVAIRPDGSLVIAFPQDFRVAVFDPAGRSTQSFGRFGHGPGEINRVTGFGLHGDTVWVMDDWRYTRWDISTGEARTDVPWRPSERRDDAPYPRGRLTDGTLVYQDRLSSHLALADGAGHSVPLLTLRGDSNTLDTLTTVDERGGAQVLKDPSIRNLNGVYLTPPFPTSDLWIAHPAMAGVLIADRRSGAAEGIVGLRIVGSGGVELASSRLRVQAHPRVTDRERSEIRDWAAGRLMEARSSSPRDRSQARRWASENLGPMEVRGPIQDLRGASDGLIWMRVAASSWMAATAGEVPGQLWIVLNPWLAPLRWVRLPPGVGFLDARGSTLWGSARDDLNVPYLVNMVLPGG